MATSVKSQEAKSETREPISGEVICGQLRFVVVEGAMTVYQYGVKVSDDYHHNAIFALVSEIIKRDKKIAEGLAAGIMDD